MRQCEVCDENTGSLSCICPACLLAARRYVTVCRRAGLRTTLEAAVERLAAEYRTEKEAVAA
jgi:hypothetical protein